MLHWTLVHLPGVVGLFLFVVGFLGFRRRRALAASAGRPSLPPGFSGAGVPSSPSPSVPGGGPCEAAAGVDRQVFSSR